MSIVLTRIDNRLVHGQILQTWVPFTNANSIIIFDDDVSNDDLQKEIIKITVPSSIEVIIECVNDVPTLLDYINSPMIRCIVLFSNIYDAYYAYKMGLEFTKLNLGNIHFHTGKKRITKTIYLDDEDIRCLKALENMKIKIELKAVPQEKGTDFF